VRVYLVANTYRPDAIKATSDAADWLTARNVTVGVDADTGRFVGLNVIPSPAFGEADLVVAFGGDGTLIRAAHLCAETGTPVLGVYYGRFGFVTQCTGEQLTECLEEFLAGKSRIESRMMLQADLLRNGNAVASVVALNEVALQRSVTARMMTFQVAVDGHVLTRYPADGVIVATPTGSTGYNLSAGGPIMDPTVQALVLTAIAPHTLNARTMVLSADSEVRLNVQSDGDAVLSADGQSRLHLLSGDQVRVTRSRRVTNLVSVERDDFLIKLGQRLFGSPGLFGDPA